MWTHVSDSTCKGCIPLGERTLCSSDRPSLKWRRLYERSSTAGSRSSLWPGSAWSTIQVWPRWLLLSTWTQPSLACDLRPLSTSFSPMTWMTWMKTSCLLGRCNVNVFHGQTVKGGAFSSWVLLLTWGVFNISPLCLIAPFSWHPFPDWLPPDAAWQMDRRVSDLWPLSGMADTHSSWKHSGWPHPTLAFPFLTSLITWLHSHEHSRLFETSTLVSE